MSGTYNASGQISGKVYSPYALKSKSPRKTMTRHKVKKERRKATADRRASVRTGLFVSLSFKNDRRSGRERRRKVSGGSKFSLEK